MSDYKDTAADARRDREVAEAAVENERSRIAARDNVLYPALANAFETAAAAFAAEGRSVAEALVEGGVPLSTRTKSLRWAWPLQAIVKETDSNGLIVRHGVQWDLSEDGSWFFPGGDAPVTLRYGRIPNPDELLIGSGLRPGVAIAANYFPITVIDTEMYVDGEPISHFLRGLVRRTVNAASSLDNAR